MSLESRSSVADNLSGGAPPPQRTPAWYAFAGVMLAATAVIAPFPFLSNTSGHDFAFHIQSWMDISWQWHQGVLFPRWAAWANFGFGEPRFIFYPPISGLLGAALGQVLPWRVVPGALIWLMLVTAGLAMFRLAREWLPPRDAIAAAVLYAANPYHLVLAYYRSDFAELVASAVLPWVVLYALRIRRGGARGLVAFALAFAATWLSNAPTAVITTYSVVLLFCVESVAEKSSRALLRGTTAMAAGFGLAAFYIVPAAWEQRWVQIENVLAPELRFDNSFLFTHSSDPEFQLFNWKVSAVAIAVIGMTALAAVFASRKRRDGPEIWRGLLALGVVSTALMFPFTRIAWQVLPKLQYVQFPWRWLVPLDVVLAAFVAAALAPARRKWIGWLAMALVLAAAGTAIARDTWWDDAGVPLTFSQIQTGQGYEGTDEYQPIGCDRTELLVSAPRVTIARTERASASEQERSPADAGERETRIHVQRWSAEDKVISVDTPRRATLALRLLNYPAWRVEIEGRAAKAAAAQVTGQMLIPVPAGHSLVEVRCARTLDRTLGGLLSLATAAILGFLWLRQRVSPQARGAPGGPIAEGG